MTTLTIDQKKEILKKRLEAKLKEKAKQNVFKGSFLKNRLSLLNSRRNQLDKEGLNFYEPTIGEYEGAWASVSGRRMLMMASYSYLGLIGHPRINKAAAEAVKQDGTGTHGVRVLAGTLNAHRELEKTIAKFKNTEDAIVFSSGYTANLATISTLCSGSDTVICDSYNHASIMDGCELSKSKTVIFDHNDMDSLESRLIQAGGSGKLVVVDGVFSMDGDIANLPEILRLCRKYQAALMVDEAHSTGMVGMSGHGVDEHFGLENDAIDIKMGTLSKVIPTVGGYVAGKKELISALKTNANAFFFSASIPPVVAAAAKAAFDVIKDEPERIFKLHENVEYYRSGIQSLGFNTLNSTTAIVPVMCNTDSIAFEITRLCHEEGVFVLPVLYPAVPVNLPRLRTSVTATHTKEDIDFSLSVFEKVGRQVGLI